MENRSQWGTRAGFILAAVGSAIGLGNIWRFPAVAYDNGGGAFFVPYLIALLTAGIPILVMEFALGHKYRGSSPLTFKKLNKNYEWFGWWQIFIAFVISTYYAVIVAWAVYYAYYSLSLAWGTDTESFLFNSHLQALPAGEIGSFVPSVLYPLIIIWLFALFVLYRGVKKGIEIANRIFIPALVILFLIIVIRAVTLDGAILGLQAFFEPNWDTIFSGEVWVAAYGQIFFSLSIAFAIMITYASYLPRKSDLTNNAFIVGFGNSSFELLAGIGVFAALGFMASLSGTSVDDVVAGGIGLAFVVFPQIINEFPFWNEFFGFLFFASLVLAGITSLISIIETYIAALVDKFGMTRTRAVIFGGGIAAIVSLLFATQGGINLVDTVDYFINHFGVAVTGFVEVILIGWVLRKLTELQKHANGISDIRVGLWWKLSLWVVTPVILGYMLYDLLRTNLLKQFQTETGNYEGYSDAFILYSGWAVVIGVIVLGIIFASMKWMNRPILEKEEDER